MELKSVVRGQVPFSLWLIKAAVLQMCVVTLYVAIKTVLTLLHLGIYAGGGGGGGGGIIISTL